MANTFNPNLIPTSLLMRAFVRPETTAGTAVAPTSATGGYVLDPLWPDQPVPYIEDEQIRFTQSLGDPIKGRREPGPFSLRVYMKPSGALGTAPEGILDSALTGLLGVKTVNASTSVVYTLAAATTAVQTYTVWSGNAIEQRRLIGSIFTKGTFNIGTAPADQASILQATFEGVGTRMSCFTYDQLGADIDENDETLTVTDGQKFVDSLGCRFQINDGGTIDDNAGAGYEILGVSGTTLTTSAITSAHTASASVTIEPWFPSITEVGAPAHSGIGAFTFAAETLKHTGTTITFDAGIMIPNDEASTSYYPPNTFIRSDKRMVEWEFEAYMRPSSPATKPYYYHTTHTPAALLCQVNGPSTVDAWKFSSPRAFITETSQVVSKAVKVKSKARAAYNSSFNNEFQISLAAP